jgi:hypothetical protein
VATPASSSWARATGTTPPWPASNSSEPHVRLGDRGEPGLHRLTAAYPRRR